MFFDDLNSSRMKKNICCIFLSQLFFLNVNFGQVINLGSLSNFVLFTSSGAIGNTGSSLLVGDIGSDLGAINGFGTSTVTGNYYNNDLITHQAKIDLLNCYNQLMLLPVTNTSHTPAYGTGETLTSGVYNIAAAGSLAGNLTLDGLGDTNAVFVFKFGAAFAAAAGSTVILTNGARSCNLFWLAEGAVAVAASAIMKGTLIANNAAISLAAGANLEGRMFTTSGAIAFGPAIASKPSCITNIILITPVLPTFNIILGTVANFVLFTSSGAVGNTGSSELTGNVGSDLGAISGFATSIVNGFFYTAGAITAQVKIDLLAAHSQLISIPTTNSTHAAAFGSGEILTKGVYSVGGAGSVIGNLTLDAQGDTNAVFIFKFGGAFTTGASSKICLINKALPCKVFWVAEGAIAMAASTTMKGTLIANNAAISMAAGGDLQGRLLSTAGAVAFGPGSAFLTCQKSYTWASTGSNLFSQPLNWSPNGNPGCSCMDNVFYNGLSSVNCDFDQSVSVNNISILTGFGGTVNANTNKAIINTDYIQSSGTFNGSTNSINIYGNYTLSGGIFNSTSGILTSDGNLFTNISGIFNHNSGTVISNRTSASPSSIIAGSFLFNKLEFTSSGDATERNINFNSSVNTASLNLNGGANAFGYVGNININNSLIINGTNTSTLSLNSGTFSIIGSGSKTIIGAGANLRNSLNTLLFNTTGNVVMLNTINISGNWINTTTGIFTQGTSTVNMIGLTSINSGTTSLTRANFDNLSIAASSTLNILGSSQINVGLNITDNGLLQPNTSLIRLIGLGSQTIGGSSVLTKINALEITNTGTKSLLHQIDILDSVKINDGTLASGAGYLSLKSNFLLKARIAEITGATGTITGNIKVETYAAGGTTDYAVIGASGVSGLTIANWAGQIPMTCLYCPYGPYATGNYFVSVKGWDELAVAGSTLAYTEKKYNSPLNIGQGVWVFLGNGLNSTSAITYSVLGAPAIGNQSIALTNSGIANGDGYNLISNPFASPISWEKLRNGNTSVSNAIYIYNADLGLTSSYVNGVSTPAAASANDIITMGQGFYVQALANTTLIAQESNKVPYNTSANQLLKTANNMQVFRLRVDGFDTYFDETVLRFEPTATNNFDTEWDAHKIYSSPGYKGYPGVWNKRTGIATQIDSTDYAINSMPIPTNQNLIIPVIVRVYQTGSYTISPIGIQNLTPGVCVNLFDKVTNINHDLRTGNYICSITDTTIKPRFILTICETNTTAISVAENNEQNNSVIINNDEAGVMVNLIFSEQTISTISVTNILGQKIIKDITVYTSKESVHLDLNSTNQLLFVTITTNKYSTTKKIIR
jgi:hypothetical protein